MLSVGIDYYSHDEVEEDPADGDSIDRSDMSNGHRLKSGTELILKMEINRAFEVMSDG